jgi:hypothetical protein
MDLYQRSTVNQLKDLLRERGLPLAGRKDDLINRLYQDDLRHGHTPNPAGQTEERENIFISLTRGEMPQLSEIQGLVLALARDNEIEYNYHDQLLDYFFTFTLAQLTNLFDGWGIPTQNLRSHDDFVDRFVAFISTWSNSGYLYPSLNPASNPE